VSDGIKEEVENPVKIISKKISLNRSATSLNSSAFYSNSGLLNVDLDLMDDDV